jgi:hypothetical protein
MGKLARGVAGVEIFDKLEPESHKNGPAPQHWSISFLINQLFQHSFVYLNTRMLRMRIYTRTD